MARRRRKHRKNPKRSHRRRHRRLRRNPGATERLTRTARRTRTTPQSIEEQLLGQEMERTVGAAKPRRRRRRLTKRQRRFRQRLVRKAKTLRGRAIHMKRGPRRSASLAQARRVRALGLLAPRHPRKSPLARALHVKTNPGMSLGVVKVLAPQVGAGAASMAVCALGGAKVAAMITQDASGALKPSFVGADGAPKNLAVYMPAISTAGIAVVGYGIANKVLPKYKGAILIGGLLGAVVQAIAASATKPGSLASKATAALTSQSPAAAVSGLGMRAYAESGMFRNVGDYTLIGDAYSTARPRNTRDNRTEWATNGLRGYLGDAYSTARPRNTRDNRTEWATNGMDDATEFAPGEGGVLSGGMFRGPSSR